jgi:CRP-like cAMP-binding protein
MEDLGLTSLALMEGCAKEQLAPIERVLHPRRLAEGEVLMREGDDGTFFALLISGELEVSRATPAGPRRAAVVGAGSIIGELSLLRGQPRTATVSATEPTLTVTGDQSALGLLLDIPEVYDRMRHLASARLAADCRPVATTLRDGGPIVLRPLLPSDRAAYSAAVQHLSPTSLRLRFFSGGLPSERMIDYLVDVDFVDHFAWLVLDAERQESGLAIARYVRSADAPDHAEVAFGVVDAQQSRGIGALLLGALGVAGLAAGIERFTATMLQDNAAMKTVFAKAGARFGFVEPGVVGTELDVATAADLLEPGLRHELDRSVHDVVTAAGLALTRPGPATA